MVLYLKEFLLANWLNNSFASLYSINFEILLLHTANFDTNSGLPLLVHQTYEFVSFVFFLYLCLFVYAYFVYAYVF